MTLMQYKPSFKIMNSSTSGITGLRAQILANYSIIDSENADAVLVITKRKKNEQELLDYPVVTYNTEEMSEAFLVTHPSKGKKVLMSKSSPWGDYETPLHKLLDQTAELAGHKIRSDYK
ncbi:MAG: hypothetical protein AUREO_031420 [Aureobasidium pullulans]|nr:MAG: hypothetical protein AUREO_031420 [Aureobasidium pullulans]